MNLDKLETILAGQPAYRAEQARQAVLKSLAENWDEVVGLPKDLRQILEKEIPLKIDAKIFASPGADSLKALVTFGDGLRVESVLMRHDNRNTVCVSSQVGCPMACSFCATGKLGFKRNLTAGEILEQVVLFGRALKRENQRVTNIVFMGMGEPFLNYDNVMAAIRTMNDQKGLNIGARHISISTCGIVEGIEKLIDEPLQVNLAISLHAPSDLLRSKLMPANVKHPIDDIMKAVLRYVKNTNRRVMFEYIMIDNVNDSDECARELAELIKSRLSLKLAFVNLIRYNPTGIYGASSPERVKAFKTVLMEAGVETTERYRFGREIKAACGQLAGDKNQ
ncbi:MAG: 23S rRNA (adenine(2503)-C(2))-methyltransferase RlmN [Candidatus Pacebacteria bacterium]|jgi:23S rRNA (adenine2503-C2)-methyltransferase|nr:23S rRNA (adenine(2503)-C(2))-methyltransferase RlmN [Candidatus Paceibacterota bacterium]